MWRQTTLRFTRPNLLELMHSTDTIISNIVFEISPFWNIHPVYCSNVVVRNVTILSPHDSPNTDGVDPDSSSNVCIEDCYISTGDDLVAVKSGWDEYGIAYAHPGSGITIRRLTRTAIGIHIKTNAGRGGFIRNITVSDMNLSNVHMGLTIAGNVGGHPDDKYGLNALLVVDGLTIKNVQGVGIQQPETIQGIKKSPFTRICLMNVKLYVNGFIRNITVSDVNLSNVHKGLRIAGNVGGHPNDKYGLDALLVVDGLTIKNVRGVGIQQPETIQGIKKSPFTRICLTNVKLYVNGPCKVPWMCPDVSGSALKVQPLPYTELTSANDTSFSTNAFWCPFLW